MAKIAQFFSEVKAELMKVVWPTRPMIIKYTIIVIVFSVAVSIVLGATDLGLVTVLQKVVNK